MENKICTICQIDKPLSGFTTYDKIKNKQLSYCMSCGNIKRIERLNKVNPNRKIKVKSLIKFNKNEYKQKWYQENKERIKEQAKINKKKYKEENSDKIKLQSKLYHLKTKDKDKEYREANKLIISNKRKEYRKNNWGKLFPGATIDVYEWVGSTLLPSEWSSQADTTQGLTLGISGQPKFPDNSIVSVKQVYDNITNSYSNVYYYWVKNSIIVPNAKNRRKSSYEVASIIADPTAYGLEFAAFISPDAVALSNVSSLLVGENISLNIGQDSVAASMTNSIPKHTEWLILQENNENSSPNALLEKKLIDSLLGHDSVGNPVPDPALSLRTRYGIGIRPRQTFFKDRITAIRNVVEFTNNVLINELITGNYDFINLNAQEQIPNRYLNTYDKIVEDNNELTLIDTTVFQQAKIQCTVNDNGQVISANIINPGFGYGTLNSVEGGYQGPTFIYPEFGSGINLSTVVDNTGAVIDVIIENGGTGYINNFIITSRPQSVIVVSDDINNGGWTQYVYDYSSKNWIRFKTQSYNTTLYWNYVDWSSSDYDQYRIYSSIIGSSYELSELTITPGQYIKINNSGNGNYIVIEALDPSIQGT